MNLEIEWKYFIPDQPGITMEDGYVRLSVVCEHMGNSGIFLKNTTSHETYKIPFSTEGKSGRLYGVAIKLPQTSEYQYMFYMNHELVPDLYMKEMANHKKWGMEIDSKHEFATFPRTENFSWEGDRPLCIPYEDTIIYGMNVRGFTAHKSSAVTHKGTFEGILEKLPYLKELGITAVELMPAYEYVEYEKKTDQVSHTIEEAVAGAFDELVDQKKRINCWGYTQGFYYAPKAAYAADDSAVTSFKQLVKVLHQNQIEVFMQFYFPGTVKHGMILDILKHWVVEYHIDGIHLLGDNLPLQIIVEEPILAETKLMYYGFPYDAVYQGDLPEFRNLAAYNEEFRTDMRRVLKGDEGMMNQFIFHQKTNPAAFGKINYMTNYDGFTLYDLVSYDRKHNEPNEESNRDGTDFNYSWNCGIEGPSRKKGILELRLKQMKNAMCLLLLSQGTPLFFGGDEFGNTRFGNNNPYNQDNEIGWIKWTNNRFSEELLSFTKELIALRKEYRILHMPTEMRNLDFLGCGYPDMSYHGKEAWRPDLSYISRSIGIMYCGHYGLSIKEQQSKNREEKNVFFMIGYNMHWMPSVLALPNLPKGWKWKKLISTEKDIPKETETEANETIADLPPRSVCIYKSEADKTAARVRKVVRDDVTAF